MAKINVYLPDELAEQVKRSGLSVSPICQQALRDEIRKKEDHMKMTGDIERVAERLRGTMSESASSFHSLGAAAGADFARNHADVHALEWLERVQSSGYEYVRSAPESMADVLDRREIQRNMDEQMTDSDHDAWFEGFVDGAVAIYEAVRPLL